MAIEALSWPNPPTLTDNVDGDQSYIMGVAFTVTADIAAPGVQWRVPDSVAAPSGGVHAVAIFGDVSGTQLAYKEFTPVPGGYQSVLFDSPITLTGGVQYVATVYTLHYVFHAGSPGGVTTLSGSATAVEGRLTATNGGAASAARPSASAGSTFYVSPLVGSSGAGTLIPSGIAVPVTLGSFTVSLGISAQPTGIAVPVTLGSFTVGATIPGSEPVTQTGGSWWQLESVARTNRENARQERLAGPLACPNDGEPLQWDPRSHKRRCPYDGWISPV